MINLEKELEEKILNAESEEEVLSILAEAGIDTTIEELRAAASADGELDEAALDNVSGGVSVLRIVARLISTPKSPFRGGGGSAGGR